jgi:transglutaminase-like putative cysteine protease
VRLVSIARYEFPYQAHLAVALLADAGIPARVTGEALHGMTSIFSSEAGGVRVEVAEDRADEARALLAAAEDAPPNESE